MFHKRVGAIVLGVLTVTGVFAGVALGSGLRHDARPATGGYTGTTSEGGTVAFIVASGGKRLTGFTTTDGYNRQCKFSGGAGGLVTFSVKIPSISISSSGLFTAVTRAKGPGPFSATLKVSGRFTASGVTGTVDKLGGTCGTGATNPTTHLYLETFTVKHS